MKQNIQTNRNVYFLFLALIFIFTGCSTVRVPISVTHPAEMNLVEHNKIAVTDLSGNIGQKFTDKLKAELVDGGKFSVVDRSTMTQIMLEINLASSDLANPVNRIKLGKLMTASLIISGHLSGGYSEKMSSSKAKCGTKKKGYYPCTRYSRTGVYSTEGSIDLTNIETGTLIKSKPLNASFKTTKSATEKTPAKINQNALMSKSINENLNEFLKIIQPWKETISVPFYKNKKLPNLEKGINQVKLGDFNKSLTLFLLAAEKAEHNSEIKPKQIAKVYFNIGLINTYLWDFEAAEAALNKAYSIDSKSKYLEWKTNATKYKLEKAELEKQHVNMTSARPIYNSSPQYNWLYALIMFFS